MALLNHGELAANSFAVRGGAERRRLARSRLRANIVGVDQTDSIRSQHENC